MFIFRKKWQAAKLTRTKRWSARAIGSDYWCNVGGGAARLLAGPLATPSLLPHPGRGTGVGHRIEDISIGKRGPRPCRLQELKESEVRSGLIDRTRIEVRFTTANANQVFLRLTERASRLLDDLDDLGLSCELPSVIASVRSLFIDFLE